MYKEIALNVKVLNELIVFKKIHASDVLNLVDDDSSREAE